MRFWAVGSLGRECPCLGQLLKGQRAEQGARESQAVFKRRVPVSGGPVVPRVQITLFFSPERKGEGNSGRVGEEGGLVEPFSPAQDPG